MIQLSWAGFHDDQSIICILKDCEILTVQKRDGEV